MTIPESQLSGWSEHGSQDASKRTHETIRRMLNTYRWPSGMTYDFYLQGSYRNDTNIRGDSDVDVVLESTSTFNYDASSLPQYDQNRLSASIQPATYSWNDFRRETLKALESGVGQDSVSQGNKSIKLKADPPRLAADVVVCVAHRRYTSYNSYIEGITFQALCDKRWIVNYPKDHYKNGATKSSRTWDRYKRTVRMFKNARNHLNSIGRMRPGLAPSYFVECLLYNAPDSAFQPDFQDTYCSVVNWMKQANLEGLACQNGRHHLFGPSPGQWSVADANVFASHLVDMWNNWS